VGVTQLPIISITQLLLKHFSYGRLRVIYKPISGNSSKKPIKEEKLIEFFYPRHPNSTIYLSMLAVLTALTTVATYVLIVPFPTTGGYFNLGDVLVMISGLLLGPVGGFIAGGIGSALADVMVAPAYAPITLIVKGLEGMTVGIIGSRTRRGSKVSPWDILAVIVASCIMLVGYLVGEIFIIGYSVGAAFAELVTINSIQVIVGSLVTLTIGPVIRSYLRDSTYSGETQQDSDSLEP
jgi:uncharacterized membrane protein